MNGRHATDPRHGTVPAKRRRVPGADPGRGPGGGGMPINLTRDKPVELILRDTTLGTGVMGVIIPGLSSRTGARCHCQLVPASGHFLPTPPGQGGPVALPCHPRHGPKRGIRSFHHHGNVITKGQTIGGRSCRPIVHRGSRDWLGPLTCAPQRCVASEYGGPKWPCRRCTGGAAAAGQRLRLPRDRDPGDALGKLRPGG